MSCSLFHLCPKTSTTVSFGLPSTAGWFEFSSCKHSILFVSCFENSLCGRSRVAAIVHVHLVVNDAASYGFRLARDLSQHSDRAGGDVWCGLVTKRQTKPLECDWRRVLISKAQHKAMEVLVGCSNLDLIKYLLQVSYESISVATPNKETGDERVQ